jgi:hypothetical protein
MLLTALNGCVRHGPTAGALSRNYMTHFGDFVPPDSQWTVKVDSTDRKLKVTRQTGILTSSTSPSQWQANAGWFVYVDLDDRVWAYDGDRELCIFELTDDGERLFGINTYPRRVPPEVRGRMSAAAQKRLLHN